VPTNTVLAATTVPTNQVPRGQNKKLVGRFPEDETTELVLGTLYAACITRTDGTGQIEYLVRTDRSDEDDPCLDSRFILSGDQTGSFSEQTYDMRFATFAGF
jgi:hypothetical protein